MPAVRITVERVVDGQPGDCDSLLALPVCGCIRGPTRLQEKSAPQGRIGGRERGAQSGHYNQGICERAKVEAGTDGNGV